MKCRYEKLFYREMCIRDRLKPILQEKEKKERLSLSQNQMKLQNETITILSIKDISNELNLSLIHISPKD